MECLENILVDLTSECSLLQSPKQVDWFSQELARSDFMYASWGPHAEIMHDASVCIDDVCVPGCGFFNITLLDRNIWN